jgi:spore maturation protein CgeB
MMRPGVQLLLPLQWGPAMPDGSLAAAAEAVTGAWIADGVLAAQTPDKFGLLIRRFTRFAAAHDVTTLAAVDRALVAKFVAAKGRTRHGVVSDPAVATMHNRRAALRAFFRTARRLRLTGSVRGVRYPESALATLDASPLRYGGWIANVDVPRAFASHRMTVHVARRPYVEALPGIPTIRVFEALACGIPLGCAPWQDSEGLFRAGEDFLVARDGAEMTKQLDALRHDVGLAAALTASGLRTIRARHTCAHRVDELLGILAKSGRERVRQAFASAEAA